VKFLSQLCCALNGDADLWVFLSIAKTRKEEIARFQKAKNDKEFAKILKSRSLGPELSETQMHLRKSIRVRILVVLVSKLLLIFVFRLFAIGYKS